MYIYIYVSDPFSLSSSSIFLAMAASPELRRLPSAAEVESWALPDSEPRISDDGYQTPATKNSIIPAMTNCPPAPKKRRRTEVSSCKRRLLDLELFRVGPELMELLFRPLESSTPCSGSSPSPKKRKNCCSG